MKNFYTAIEERRTHYGISKEKVTSDERIQEVIEFSVKHTPSAFNSQGERVVVLLEKEHDQLWDITMNTLKKIVPAENFKPTEEKILSFRNGYGTVLYFEDRSTIEGLQSQFPTYKENFPVWSQQSNGMLQFAIWNALQLEGFGASLQHYSELIEGEVKKAWNLPEKWKLLAQMPFGKPVATPNEKIFQPIENRVKVVK